MRSNVIISLDITILLVSWQHLNHLTLLPAGATAALTEFAKRQN